ncbi:helix-turn-helix domain-containing protein [Nonomuraea sp. NPDC003754]
MTAPSTHRPTGTAGRGHGAIVRKARQAAGLTLAELGSRTGYSASQVSRYERGLAPLTDLLVLRRFAGALNIAPQTFGLAPDAAVEHRARVLSATALPSAAAADSVASGQAGEDDPVRRRQLLTNLALTAAAGSPLLRSGGPVSEADAGALLITRVRDAMLGLGPAAADVPAGQLGAALATAHTDFHACRYVRLADRLPLLLATAHAAGDAMTGGAAMLAEIYTLITRLLVKMDDQQLGWMAADRARVLAAGAEKPLLAAEAARQLAVLARKAGWYDQAMTIALSAAEHPALADGSDARYTAQRGLLIQCAAYTAAHRGDRTGMRELTDEAAAIAARLIAGPLLLRDHGGGFTPATVQLHRISAEYAAGDVGAALTAARRIRPAGLPTTERRARYFTDLARAHGLSGGRDHCLAALLAAERQAPQETHARPAVRDLVQSLLISGRTSPELRGLALRCGIS